MNPHPALRLTPQNSPFYRSSTPKSPSKVARGREPGLQLRKVIGTTTATANAFDCLPEARAFAYTAGAAAVYATIGEDLRVTQRFFRAKTTPAVRDGNGWPASPTPNEPRNKAIGHVKEHNLNGSPLASSGRDWSDSPTGRSSTAKDRIKAATSVAISPDGKWLAIGESGYKPRVAIFFLAEESSDLPVATLSEHSFGVHALRFSPDSKFLASLGTVNDGFLYVWNIDDKTGAASLYASNKLTAVTNVLTWMGNIVVTAGLRFVKVWRPDDDAFEPRTPDIGSSQFLSPRHRTENRSSDYGNSIFNPKHKTLTGKNSLLGDLLECNFVAAVTVSESTMILCAESGEICLLDDRDKGQTITLVQTANFGTTAARLSPGGQLHVLGAQGNVMVLEPDAYQHPSRPSSRARRNSASPMKSPANRAECVIASTSFGATTVELDSERNISLHQTIPGAERTIIQLAAHREPVLGVQSLHPRSCPDARFFTFSATGVLHFWDGEGALAGTLHVPIPSPAASQGYVNELKAVAMGPDSGWIVSGDKYGVLSLIDLGSRVTVTQARAHSAEIMDLAVFQHEGLDLVATAGRDRMVQLFVFTEGQLSLLQTMDEHAGAVTGILYDHASRRLLTHSADRTVVLREAFLRDPDVPASLAFAMVRTIPLKASPTSMCSTGDGELLIATVDRCIARYKLKNGHCILSFKCSDNEGGEAVIMSKILYAPSLNGNPTIAGISSSDKSVRLYTDYGSLVARDWGHSEGITDVCLTTTPSESDPSQPPTTRLITAAADSTIFIWDTTLPTHSPLPDPSASPTHLDTPLGPPLRKVLSHTELSRFRRKKSLGSNAGSEPPSPSTATHHNDKLSPSPQRVRKRPSRVSVAPLQKSLEPAFRAPFASPRQERLKGRSPSPPSPRNTLKKGQRAEKGRRTSLKEAFPVSPSVGGVSAVQLSASLRTFRKATLVDSETAALKELDRELCLTRAAVAERCNRGGETEEMGMDELLDEASSKLVSLLDDKIKERVEVEVRKGSLGDRPEDQKISRQEVAVRQGGVAAERSNGHDVRRDSEHEADGAEKHVARKGSEEVFGTEADGSQRHATHDSRDEAATAVSGAEPDAMEVARETLGTVALGRAGGVEEQTNVDVA